MNREVVDAAKRLDRAVDTVLALVDDTSIGGELDDLKETKDRLFAELRRLGLLPAVL